MLKLFVIDLKTYTKVLLRMIKLTIKINKLIKCVLVSNK